jgi:hypothetical protein
MLPDLPRLLAGYELFAQRNNFAPVRDEVALASALEEAASLARGQEPDEPAALFCAFARRPRDADERLTCAWRRRARRSRRAAMAATALPGEAWRKHASSGDADERLTCARRRRVRGGAAVRR